MIRTVFKSRFRAENAHETRSREQRTTRRDGAPRRDNVSRREYSTVVHPWMSLPDRLAQTQAAMSELAGQAAFNCPLDEKLTHTAAPAATEPKVRSGGVSITIRKRRLPASASNSALTTG